MKRSNTQSALILAAIGFACSGYPAHAHTEDNFNSIHFHSGQPDFGTLPRRAIISYRGEYDDRPNLNYHYWPRQDRSQVELTEEKDGWEAAKTLKQRNAMLAKAMAELRAGHWQEASDTYTDVIHNFGVHQGERNRAHVLELAIQHRDTPALGADLVEYESCMDALDSGIVRATGVRFTALAAETKSPWLKAHAQYQAAGVAYKLRDFPTALQGFRETLEGWTDGALREDTLIMVARSALQSGRPVERKPEMTEWALAKLRSDFPATRFHNDLFGLKARLTVMKGDYASAISLYFGLGDIESVEWVLKHHPEADRGIVRPRLLSEWFQRLGSAMSYKDYEQAVYAIDRIRQSFSVADAAGFSHILDTNPVTAASYLYYRLYLSDATSRDFKRLADMARRIGKQWATIGREHDPGRLDEINVRIAEVFYQNHDYPKAMEWARRSLAVRTNDRAMFINGVCRFKEGHASAATAVFNNLLQRFPMSHLRRATREELAQTYERTGNLSAALDQYYALDYSTDIAFLLDTRMTLGEVREYVRTHPGQRNRSALLYTMGVRCLRDERYHEANQWFAQVPKQTYHTYTKHDDEWMDAPSADGMTTAAQLQYLHDAILTARGDARAQAEYRYASYIYKGGTLLFYNATLWEGERAQSFGYWWNPTVASKDDTAVTRQYMYDHEVFARTLTLCTSIAQRYPHSSVAPQALYRAACAARLLANFNGWWRNEDDKAGLWNQSISLMKQVTTHYPESPLASHARKYMGVFRNEKDGKPVDG